MLSLTNMIRLASIIGLLAMCVLYATPEVYAAQFQPMVGVPGLDTSGSYTFIDLINRLYIFLIAIGAVIGVIKIALAGVKWATSASGSSISAAKEDIKGVLLGLIILTIPYIVLSIINPQFANLDVLKLKPLSLPAAQSQSTGSGNSNGGGFTPVPSQATPPNGYVRSGSPCTEKRPEEFGKCNTYGHTCTSAGGTVVHSNISSAGGSTLYSFQCYKPPVAGSNEEQTRSCGSCVAASGDGKCIAFETACAAGGGVANPVKEGNSYRSTCMVPQSITPCPDLPNP